MPQRGGSAARDDSSTQWPPSGLQTLRDARAARDKIAAAGSPLAEAPVTPEARCLGSRDFRDFFDLGLRVGERVHHR